MSFDPVTAAVIAGVTGGFNAFKSVRGGIVADKAAKVQATALEQQAKSSRQLAADKARIAFRKGSAARARNRAASFGRGGANRGSILALDDMFTADFLLDAALLQHQGDLAAVNLQNSASQARFRGRNARIGGFLDAGSSLLSAGGSAFGKFAPKEIKLNETVSKESFRTDRLELPGSSRFA